MFCRKCGINNDENAYQCTRCGEILQDVQQVQQPGQQLPEVNSHLVLAILTTLFCCLPLGIVSIIYAAQVGTKRAAGDYQGALDCSKKAATFGYVALGIGLVWIVIYAILMVIGISASNRGF